MYRPAGLAGRVHNAIDEYNRAQLFQGKLTKVGPNTIPVEYFHGQVLGARKGMFLYPLPAWPVQKVFFGPTTGDGDSNPCPSETQSS